MKSKSFLSLHRQQESYHVEGPERYQDHWQNRPWWHQWVQPKYYKNTFWCANKKKINNDFVQQFFSRESPCASILESNHKRASSACKQGAVHACSISSTTRRDAHRALFCAGKHAHASWYSPKWCLGWLGAEELLNKLFLFVYFVCFFAHKMYSS